MSGKSISTRAVDAPIYLCVVFFGCWTLSYHAVFVLGLPALYTLPLFPLFLAYGCTIIIRELRAARHDGPARDGSHVLAALALIAAASAFLTLVVARPDMDDLYFLHRALVQTRELGSPYITTDTTHNVPGIPSVAVLQLVTSYEMLTAFSARLLGMDPLNFYHNLFPAVAALAVPFIYFLLYRELGLDDIKSAAGTAGAVVFLWLGGGRSGSFG